MNASDLSIGAARRLFWTTFFGTLLLKLVLAAGFPFTGDEAFFYQWGVYPAWGYSDHPPMVGWLLAVLHSISDAPLVLRSVTLLVTSAIALLIVNTLMHQLRPDREAVAWLAGAVYLVLPWSWMFVLVTTDTPLILFMALSAWAYLRANAAEQRSAGWYALAGLFVGLAFLSKYFAALLGIAYAVHILGWRRDRWWALPLMFVLALPSIAVNLVFNAHHGWSNVMFNVFNRNEGSHWNVKTPAVYAAMTAYLLTPWLLWQGVKGRWADGISPATRTAATALWLFPVALFAVISLKRTIGLHWVLGFVPLFVIWAGLRLDTRALRTSFKATLALSLPHLIAVAALAWAPLSLWQPAKIYDRLVFTRETPALAAARQTVSRLFEAWDDRLIEPAAAVNLFLDRSKVRRRAEFEALGRRPGACRPDEGFELVENALRGSWLLRCDRGQARASVTLAPTLPPTIQYMDVREVPEQGGSPRRPSCPR